MKKEFLVVSCIQGIIPSYVGIIVNHFQDPRTTGTRESKKVFFVAQLAGPC